MRLPENVDGDRKMKVPLFDKTKRFVDIDQTHNALCSELAD